MGEFADLFVIGCRAFLVTGEHADGEPAGDNRTVWLNADSCRACGTPEVDDVPNAVGQVNRLFIGTGFRNHIKQLEEWELFLALLALVEGGVTVAAGVQFDPSVSTDTGVYCGFEREYPVFTIAVALGGHIQPADIVPNITDTFLVHAFNIYHLADRNRIFHQFELFGVLLTLVDDPDRKFSFGDHLAADDLIIAYVSGCGVTDDIADCGLAIAEF